ncbi:hypothetical protein CK203_062512 [Vitis vinifera]|uniref:Uncharacterized protein n=1 Tax=Vitis vinifera TaxID=29760 RepID=A0A438G4Q5_VITVI|nr:hypothetical protein CK203_062512 [Vitis vinifera]
MEDTTPEIPDAEMCLCPDLCPMVIFSHRHLTLPFLCPDNSNYLGSGAQAKMNDFTVFPHLLIHLGLINTREDSSTFETSINNDMDHGDGPVSYESTLVNSLPDCLVSVNDSEGDSNGITYCSETSETCTSCTDDMDVSEDTINFSVRTVLMLVMTTVPMLVITVHPNGVVDSCNNADRMKLHSAAVSSSDIQLDARGKRDKQAKMVVENAHGCVGKENVGCFQLDKTLKEAPLFKRNCNNANIASKSEDKNRSTVKVHRKSKKNSSPGSKQEYNCHSRKRSLAMKASSNAPARINIQENEMSNLNYKPKELKALPSELVHSLQDCTGNLEPPERCSTISNMKDHITEGQNNSLLESLDSLNMSSLHEGQSAVHLHPLIVMKKWKPVAKKNSGFASLGRSDISLLAHADEPAAEDKSPIQNTCTPKQLNNKHPAVTALLTLVKKNIFMLLELIQARYQVHYMMPIGVKICQTCVRDEVGSPLCRHEAPNITLRACGSVQLFKKPRSHHMDNGPVVSKGM